MKDSGIKWIGKIPDGWSTIRIKFTSWLKGRIGWDGLKSSEFVEKGPYLITGTDFENGGINWNTCVHISEARYQEDELLHIKENDLLITKDGTIGKLAIVKNCPEKVSLNSGVMIIRGNSQYKYSDKYLYYVLQSDEFFIWFELSQNGNSTIRHLYQGQFYNFEFSYPTIDEQQAIAAFLDKKCFVIDNLISNETKQIEKLKEYRQAIITKAVTKGLDPNAPMKDSGVEWIGKIKQDYRCEKLKFLLSSPMLYGANESGGKQEKGCTRFIRITDIDSNGNLKDTNDNQYLSASKSTGYILKNKDILFARSGGTVGKSFLYKDQGFPCSFAGYLIKAECNETLLLPEFLYYYTKSSLYEIWKNMIFVQSTIQNIGAQRYGNLDIVIPSIAEQKQIVQYIDKKCMLINKLIDIKDRTRKQLLDFKQSLIYEYVTGKKRVSL